MNRIENIINQEKLDSSIKSQAIMYKGELYTYFDKGLTRYVFVNKDKTRVIKLLIDKNGKNYNEEEADIYNDASDELKSKFAETNIACNGLIVEQEFCNPIKFDDRKLNIPQLLFASSCRNEVGWTKDGKLVCFDLDEYKRY